MPCPVCSYETITTKALPLELYGQDGAPPWRIPQAQWQTCGRCGASWYEDSADAGTGVPIPESVVPVYDASDD